MGGMLGDKVVIPGSPALTIPELLDEAERSLDLGLKGTPRLSALRTPAAFVTPEPQKSREAFAWATPDLSGSFAGEGLSVSGAWTRKEWKKLDSCLTDERLAMGRDGGLADVGDVDLEKVVDRFFAMVLEPAIGVEWTR